MSRLINEFFHVPEKIVGYSCDEICDKEVSCEECPIQEAFNKLAHYEDLEETGRLITLPCNIGDELYRITYPYRQPPKVTKYRVKNFRTIKKGQKLQIEVQADCVPAKNWMYFEDFYTTKAEAEAKLEQIQKGE